MTLLFEKESYTFLGACFEVYKDKGSGFLEAVYQECLEIEFADQAILFSPRSELKLTYKGRTLQQVYVPDFVCFTTIIVEIKAVKSIANEHRAQVHNYLKATGFRLGLLVNFGHFPLLEHERIIR